MLDLDRLDLGLFERGAIIRSDGRFRRLADPRHAPVRSLRALAGGLVGVRDGAAVLKLLRGSGDETTTADALRRAGVSRTHGRDLLRAVPARDLPRGAAHDVEPLSRLRPARVLRRAGGAAGRRHGSDRDAARGGRERAQGHRRRDRRATCRLARVGRPAPGRRRRRRDLGSRRRARARVERRHLRVLRRTLDPDPGAVARRQRRGRPDQQPLRAERGGAELRPSRPRARLGHDPRCRRAGSRAGRAPAPRLVRLERRRLAPPADVPDPAGAARLPGRRLRRRSRCASPRASTPAATTASIRR